MKKYLGIEFGSTLIKAVLINESYDIIASGDHGWENKLTDGHWTYHLDDVWAGVRDAYEKLAAEYREKFGADLTELDGLGVSAMMHGYLVFDKNGEQLTPFRTWRNTTTEEAARLLSERFKFNIPQRWSIAHICQAYLDKEDHVEQIDFMTTLAGYVHWKLTGQKVLGIGDASGVMPVCGNTYDISYIDNFRDLTGISLDKLLPKVLSSGENGGALTTEGARLLDPSGKLNPGVPFCPPEGDAGTGMTATNSVAALTGNVSAGTSVFAMVVLDKPLSDYYTEIDMVTTPDGKPVAMVHCNTCTSDIDAWVQLFGEAAALMGAEFDKTTLYSTLYNKAFEGDPSGGGLVSYNYYSGEPVVGLNDGRPLFARLPDAKMNLADFMRVQLYSSMAALKLGMDILTERENVSLKLLLGHGGLFRTKGVAQRLMAAALDVPVAVQETAGQGGAWGIALLAAYSALSQNETLRLEAFSLEAFLDKVFANSDTVRIEPDSTDTAGFRQFMERYVAGLPIERAAAECLKS